MCRHKCNNIQLVKFFLYHLASPVSLLPHWKHPCLYIKANNNSSLAFFTAYLCRAFFKKYLPLVIVGIWLPSPKATNKLLTSSIDVRLAPLSKEPTKSNFLSFSKQHRLLSCKSCTDGMIDVFNIQTIASNFAQSYCIVICGKSWLFFLPAVL